MRCAGLDIGSRSIELVILDDGKITHSLRTDTTYNPLARLSEILAGLKWDIMAATGYGRTLAAAHLEAEPLTEIRAHARGARHLFPGVRTVLDIGGQDTKVIVLGAEGSVVRFEMNDRCAAGTGKFLEFMAAGLQVPIEEFGVYALRGTPGTEINSMCTVFAESEATTLMARGTRGEDIALALHRSVVRRSMSMLARVGLTPPLLFCGGVARNECIHQLFRKELSGFVGTSSPALLIPEHPEMVGALGAALVAMDRWKTR